MALVTFTVIAITFYVYLLALLSARVRVQNMRLSDDQFFFVLLVPALNEAQVIGKTITSLQGLHGNFLALIIDDASDDGTVAAIKPFLVDPRFRLLQQAPERARRGKGHVLNTGFAELQRLGLIERYGPDNVIVVVFDSDGRVEPDFLQAVAPYFRDPKIAGVQSAVRMYNANQNLLTLWQHLEFAIWGKLFCRAKNLLGSATLGGNGQCVRFSALLDLGEEPWLPSSLTEDLEMSLRLLARGWQLRFCVSVAVWQEAVPRLRALVRQRSRWLQGHVVCWSYLPALLRSRRLPFYTRLDLLLFLLLPSVFLPIGLTSLVSMGYFLFHLRQLTLLGIPLWYLLGFGMAPLVIAAWREIDHPRPWRLVFHGHLFVFYSFVWFLAAIVVYRHILLGRRGWAKTSRVGMTSGEWRLGVLRRIRPLGKRTAGTTLAIGALLAVFWLGTPRVFAGSERLLVLWPTPRAMPNQSTMREGAAAPLVMPQVALTDPVSGRLEVLYQAPNGTRTSQIVRFDFGNNQRTPRLHIITRAGGASEQDTEQMAIGTQAWRRVAGGPWVALPTSDELWAQVRVLLPQIPSVTNSVTDPARRSLTLRWYDTLRGADITVQVDTASGEPRQQSQVVRATGETCVVTYLRWNETDDIAALLSR